MKSKLRIIGGQWRSRQLIFEDTPGLRPTPARVKETLFNWLQQDVVASDCLDLFAGSGALGFEAASRGAGSVLMVENSQLACQQIHENIQKLDATQVAIQRSDVFRFLAGDAVAYDLVFLDPPFGKGLVHQVCHWLQDKGWLMPEAKVYVEVESGLQLNDLPENWECVKEKKAGEVKYCLFKVSSKA